MDDLEVIGLRRLTSGEQKQPQQQHSPATPAGNTSADFEWDFGDESNNTPATRRLDHLVQQHQFTQADRRRRMMNMSMDADIVKSCALQANRITLADASRSMDELDGPSHLTVDVIDGSSIGPRFGGRGLRKASSSSSNQSSNFAEPELTLLPSQTYPDFPDFGSGSHPPGSGRCSANSATRMETVFDVDSAVYTRHQSSTSIASNKKKEKDWYETSLDSPVPGRKGSTTNLKQATSTESKPAAPLPSPTATAVMNNGTSTVRAQPVRLADHDHEDDFEFETVVPFESPKNLELIAPGKFEPYREISKPFETSDIYKYSAKYRQQQNNNKTTQNQQQTKGSYQPLQPLACQPLTSKGSHNNPSESGSSASNGEMQHSNPPVAGPEFRSKPATLV